MQKLLEVENLWKLKNSVIVGAFIEDDYVFETMYSLTASQKYAVEKYKQYLRSRTSVLDTAEYRNPLVQKTKVYDNKSN